MLRPIRTSEPVSKASKVLSNPKSSKSVKSVAGSALSQKHGGGKKKEAGPAEGQRPRPTWRSAVGLGDDCGRTQPSRPAPSRDVTFDLVERQGERRRLVADGVLGRGLVEDRPVTRVLDRVAQERRPCLGY